MKATVFLGGGRITGALLAGLRIAKDGRPILVYDRHPEKLSQLKKLYRVATERNLHSAVKQAHLLIIAVRPDSVSGLLRDIGKVDHPLNAVSLAAGVPFSKLRAVSGLSLRWARAMPSPVCRSGRGLTALTFDRGFPSAAKRDVKSLFTKVGTVLEIPESKFDAFTVTYSCTHGYHALATLADAAEQSGLDGDTALTAAAHALADSILAWRDGNIPLNELLQEAATPGGIAATVMNAMDSSGYRKVVGRGLRAGILRARKNAKKA